MTVRELITGLLAKCASEKIAADVCVILAGDSSPQLDLDVEATDEYTGSSDIKHIDMEPKSVVLSTDYFDRNL
jgi:hypothetical protein